MSRSQDDRTNPAVGRRADLSGWVVSFKDPVNSRVVLLGGRLFFKRTQ